VSVAVPDAEVTVPALHVADVGAAVAPCPRDVITHVAPAIVFAAVSVPVAVAVLELLKDVSSTVCPIEPTTVHPLDAVIDATPVAVKLTRSVSVSAELEMPPIGCGTLF
jgi:hypothetical protein